MPSYDARVGDYGAESAVRRSLTRGSAPLSLSGASVIATAVAPSGTVHQWTADHFTIVSAATGVVDIVAPDPDVWDEVETWRITCIADFGDAFVQADPIEVSVGPGTVPSAAGADLFDQTISSGVIDENGNKLYGEGFFVSVLGTGSFVLMFEDNVRLEAATVFHAWAQSTSLVHASMAWASGNMAYVYLMDASGAAVSVPFAFLVEDAT